MSMQVVYYPESPPPPWRDPVVGLGNFDGIHRGHMRLLERVRRQAGERGGTPVALIFDPHPPRVLRPEKAPPLLMTLDQKLEAFERAGMQGVAIVRFTREIAAWEPEHFVETVLLEWLRVAEVWVGANFLFGRNRSGTYTLLRALGEDRGFRADKIDPVRYTDFVVSSTRIRHLIGEGRVDEAAALLGHQYFLDGTVVHGDGRGRELGFPTANLETANELLPAFGIYATMAVIDGVHHPSVTSVGIRPTVGDGRVTIEAHLLDGDRDLYGRRVRLALVQWLREERKFDDWAALTAQIALDAEAARDLFRRMEL
jgi:riboflavin kinase/FMN adenylyltransferase